MTREIRTCIGAIVSAEHVTGIELAFVVNVKAPDSSPPRTDPTSTGPVPRHAPWRLSVEYVPVIGVTFTFLTILGAVLLYLIRAEIAKATKPIQPNANGGKSLPDVAANTAVLVERQTDVIRDLRELRERVDQHITWHVDN